MSDKNYIISEANIANILLKIGAVKLRPNNPFKWASGILSPIYCDNRKTLSYPDARKIIIEAFAKVSKEYQPFDTIAGVATGGIAHGVLTADKLNMPFIYVRSNKKKHGTGQQVEGEYKAGQKCLVIEDLISTGKSSLEAVDALREEGLIVNTVISVFSYEFAEATESFISKYCEYRSLTNYSTLLKESIEQGLIEEKDLKKLNEWRKNPRTWKQ
ncbi:MAG: orotate phosphoribosyltransferase [Saprospiraceae bacterium]